MKNIKLTFWMILFSVSIGFGLRADDFYTTAAGVPTGIAVGPGMTVEISFPTMEDPEDCGFRGAYQISGAIDAATRKAMLAVLVSAKATNTPVWVRLQGCSDRPLITYIFTDAYPK